MPNTLTHKTLSAAAQPTNAALIGGPQQNEEHLFSGGADGALLVRNLAKSDGADWLVGIAAGSVLVSAGVATRPVWTLSLALASLTLTAPLPVASGGTAFGSGTTGDILHFSGSGTIGKLAAVAVGSVLSSNGVGGVPAWSTTPTISGTLSVGTTTAVAGLSLVVAGGAIGFLNDSTNDIGTSTNRRPAVVYAGTAIVVGGSGNAAATGALRLPNISGGVRFRNNANGADITGLSSDATDTVTLGDNSFATLLKGSSIKWGVALVALGGGSAPTVGTIGGSGPATAGQNAWLKALDSTGAAIYIPVWK